MLSRFLSSFLLRFAIYGGVNRSVVVDVAAAAARPPLQCEDDE